MWVAFWDTATGPCCGVQPNNHAACTTLQTACHLTCVNRWCLLHAGGNNLDDWELVSTAAGLTAKPQNAEHHSGGELAHKLGQHQSMIP